MTVSTQARKPGVVEHLLKQKNWKNRTVSLRLSYLLDSDHLEASCAAREAAPAVADCAAAEAEVMDIPQLIDASHTPAEASCAAHEAAAAVADCAVAEAEVMEITQLIDTSHAC